MGRIQAVLVQSGDYTASEAEEVFHEMCERVLDGENPEHVLEDYDLEPDYIEEII